MRRGNLKNLVVDKMGTFFVSWGYLVFVLKVKERENEEPRENKAFAECKSSIY